MDTPIYKKSISALRCFNRAVEIDCYNCKLWIEYGSLAYILHSHATRQLKWVSTGSQLEIPLVAQIYNFTKSAYHTRIYSLHLDVLTFPR